MTSFVVWQVWPWNSNVLFTARFGEWPQGAVLFALGVHAAGAGGPVTVRCSAGVAICFLAGYALTRVPGISKVL